MAAKLSSAPRLGFYLLLFYCSSLTACAHPPSRAAALTPLGDRVITPIPAVAAADASVLADYTDYETARLGLRARQSAPALAFLNSRRGQDNAMITAVRTSLLQLLGKNGDWDNFARQYTAGDDNDAEVNCYAAARGLGRGENTLEALTAKLVGSNELLSEGCNTMLAAAAARGLLSNDDLWRRVRILLAHNYVTSAQNLAAAAGEPLTAPAEELSIKAAKIKKIMPFLTPKGRKNSNAAGLLAAAAAEIDREDLTFTRGVLGLSRARSLLPAEALVYFTAADPGQFSLEDWEWYARSALRLGRWQQLQEIIAAMPAVLAVSPGWQYWRARAAAALGKRSEAESYYAAAAASGRNFYALLAAEELHLPVNTKSNAPPPAASQLRQLENNSSIQRALVLFSASEAAGDAQMRLAAGQQWRYAVKGFSDEQLIAAATLAYRRGFYEMAIYSADLSLGLLDFSLRFPAPHLEIINRYAAADGIDSAWVLGLIRQESRFMPLVRSGAGAAGLMQIMPATAAMIARKLDLDRDSMPVLESNIQMGVWYLADLYQQFGSLPLATAAYNAGPGRPRAWRQNGLEGAVFIETIPFTETRDYTKKVMSNTFYYARILGGQKRTLKSIVGGGY